MLLEHLKSKNAKEAHNLLSAKQKPSIENYVKEYNYDRKIRDTQVGKRPRNSDNTEPTRLHISMPQKIVRDGVSFLFGSPINMIPSDPENKGAQDVKDLWKSCRMDSLLMEFCEAVKSETEAAIIFYSKKKDGQDVVIKPKLITSENGKMYPYFDEFGDLIAFGWEFKTKDEKGEDLSKMLVFTDEKKYTLKQGDKGWEYETEEANLFKKIPVVYLSQKEPDWFIVNVLIDRLEMSFSKFCDTNDYFFNPFLMAIGTLSDDADGEGEPLLDREETARVLRADVVETPKHGNIVQGDARYLTWDQVPETVKLEFETLKDMIYGLSSTPNLTIEAVKGIGQIANAGVTLMFLAPILKAKLSEGRYRTSIERMISVMKAGLTNVTNSSNKAKLPELSFEINFTSVLPKNVKEMVDALVEANGGKAIISQESSVAHNPLVKDAKSEMANLTKEAEADKTGDLGDTKV